MAVPLFASEAPVLWPQAVEKIAQTSTPSDLLFAHGAPDQPGLCTYFVSTEGNDSNTGRSEAQALESISAGVDVLLAGDTLCLMSGIYPAPLMVDDKLGTEAHPIVIRAIPGSEGQVVIQDGPRSKWTGLSVTNSSHVHVLNLDIQRVLRGIQFNSVTGGIISGNVIANVEQEAIRVGALTGSDGVSGAPSSHIKVNGNVISKTGRRSGMNAAGIEYRDFGEGIYIGTGKYDGDDTHDIIVSNNVISETTAESIEIKPYTYDITVSENRISNVTLPYSAAISVAIGPESIRNGNFLIEENSIHHVKSRQYTVAGIVVGQGNAMIRNNTVWDVEGGRGIRIYTTFAFPGARTVTIQGNTVWNPGSDRSIAIDDGDGGFDMDERAIVFTSENITDDGSGDSQLVTGAFFAGPITGDADAGNGAGSGFRAR